MKIYHLILYSKNKRSLNKAFSILLDYINITDSINQKYLPKKTKKHFVSILKSPHVNKKSQEQFDFRIYSKQFSIYCYSQDFKYFLYILKKIKDRIFSDVTCKIKFSIDKNKKKLKVFDLNNFKINTTNDSPINQNKNLYEIKNQKTFRSPTTKKIKKLLKMVDSYGEIEIS